jgi:hypothetical protein
VRLKDLNRLTFKLTSVDMRYNQSFLLDNSSKYTPIRSKFQTRVSPVNEMGLNQRSAAINEATHEVVGYRIKKCSVVYV